MATKSARKSKNSTKKSTKRKPNCSGHVLSARAKLSLLSLQPHHPTKFTAKNSTHPNNGIQPPRKANTNHASPRQTVQKLPRRPKMLVALFLRPKLRRMRNQAAPRTPRGMLHMQHLVIQNVLHNKLRHTRPVHPPVQNDLIRPGIVTPKLPPPHPAAPRDVRPLQLPRKILPV